MTTPHDKSFEELFAVYDFNEYERVLVELGFSVGVEQAQPVQPAVEQEPFTWALEWWDEDGEYEVEYSTMGEFSFGRKNGFPLYRHPPQPVQYPLGCAVNQLSSRMCERGTPGCVIEHESHPVQPNDTPEEFNAQSFFSLWSSYCDKKMEIEDLKAVNEQLLDACKSVQNRLRPKTELREKIDAAIAAAEAAKGGV